MIHFKSVALKNFFSVGDDLLKINLDKNQTTLISGTNGSGKSVTLVDSICFALFGKPHRKVNKSQIINSINEKKCLVELEFEVDNIPYKIFRGLKPNIFEIYKNGELINQDSNAKDYQKNLEENILGLNYDSFCQVVILSSSNFISFMELNAAQRRKVIEEILDIEIFSKMNQALKDRISDEKLKDNLIIFSQQITSIDDQIENLQQTIQTLQEDNDKIKEEKEAELREATSYVEKHKDDYEKIRQKNRTILSECDKQLKKVNDQITGNSISIQKLERELKVKEREFNNTNELLRCPKCNQLIDDKTKEEMLSSTKDEISKLKIELENKEKLKIKYAENKKVLDSAYEKIQKEKESIDDKGFQISLREQKVRDINNELKKLHKNENYGGLANLENDVKKKEKEKKKVKKDYNTLKIQEKYYNFLSVILKDSGIKAQVIKEYIPVINKQINYYLSILDFFVSFELNENFDETIKQNYCDPRSYSSLSQGEKQRVDLSMLFTWRDVARMKNSIDTNLLILDETFDSSLDNDGIENLMKILETVSDKTNVFIISHKGEKLEDKIPDQLIFEKRGNFTVMRQE